MPSYATPQEAARAELEGDFLRYVGAVVRGDEAVVAHWVFDPVNGCEDTETTTCYRDAAGWEAGSTGNGNGSAIWTAPDRVTAIVWDRAPEGAVACRFRVAGREQRVPVEDGFFMAVFDDLPYQEPVRHEPPGESAGWTGVRLRRSTPEEARAWRAARRGFEFPELVEWMFEEGAQ